MKSERGSVTLFVLVSMIFFLVIAMTAYVSSSVKLQGENEEVARIKASYEQDINDEDLLQLYNKITKTRDWLQGDGTEKNTYKIYTIEDLVTLSLRSNDEASPEKFENKYIELMNSLDFNRDSSYANSNRTDFGDLNGDHTIDGLKTELTKGTGFPCVSVNSDNAFSGIFQGNGYEIKNIYINSNSTRSGLFGFISNATIQDLELNGEITNRVDSSNHGASGIASYSSGNSIIKNCINKSNIKKVYSNGSIAGIVADTSEGSNTIIENCSNTGAVSMVEGPVTTTGSGNTAGLVGCNMGTVTLIDCYNSGSIKNDIGSHTGGLVGRDNSTTTTIKIINSYNSGTISSRAVTGGIIGLVIGKASVVNSYNKGNIVRTNNSNNGGIIGQARAGTTVKLNNVFNIGNIDGINNRDGIIGENFGTGEYINCYYEKNDNYNGVGSSNIDIIILETTEIKNANFIVTLNNNKNSINLANYEVTGYTLSSWKTGTSGYPEFDW